MLDLDGTETLDSAGLTALLNCQDALRGAGGRDEDRHDQRDEPQDPRNHPPRPATRSVRQRDRRREELPDEPRPRHPRDHDHDRRHPCPATPRRSAGRAGLPHRRAACRPRWRSRSRADAASCWARSSSSWSYCTEDQIVECLAAEYGVPYAKLDARLFDPKIVDVLPREYIEKNLVLPLFVGPRHADDRRLRAVEPVPDRRDPRPARTCRCRSSPPRPKTSGG